MITNGCECATSGWIKEMADLEHVFDEWARTQEGAVQEDRPNPTVGEDCVITNGSECATSGWIKEMADLEHENRKDEPRFPLTGWPYENDPVNSPNHYRQGEIETIDGIQSALTEEEFRGYCKGNAMKYIWRERGKGGGEDLRKANWYLNRIGGK